MKSTIKLDRDRAVVVQPSKAADGHVSVIFENERSALGQWGLHLTLDQVGALMFALEQAAEAAQIAQHRTATVAGGVVS